MVLSFRSPTIWHHLITLIYTQKIFFIHSFINSILKCQKIIILLFMGSIILGKSYNCSITSWNIWRRRVYKILPIKDLHYLNDRDLCALIAVIWTFLLWNIRLTLYIQWIGLYYLFYCYIGTYTSSNVGINKICWKKMALWCI